MVVLCLVLQVGGGLILCVVYGTSLAVTYFTVCERDRQTDRQTISIPGWLCWKFRPINIYIYIYIYIYYATEVRQKEIQSCS
jgi:hypothetical protein